MFLPLARDILLSEDIPAIITPTLNFLFSFIKSPSFYNSPAGL
jgi:hypothetical protein